MPPQKKEKSLSKDQLHKIITKRLRKQRPESWESDISVNALDTEPFDNLPPAKTWNPDEFLNSNNHQNIEPLLANSSLKKFIDQDVFPVPCVDDREGYCPDNDADYWLQGLEDYLKIMEVAKRHHLEPKTVLDFGCASGRVIRHFAAHSEIPEIWGTDINARHIRWLYEFMPHTVKPIFNHCIPSLPIRDRSVDIIYAFSVFTHIDTFETCWLAELQRIMSDDGLCYLTVHNENTWNVIRKEVDNPDNRLVQSILKIDPAVRKQLNAPLPDTRTVYRFSQSGPYRSQVFHSNNYLKRVWGRFFSIEEILPCHHVRQTVLVLRPR